MPERLRPANGITGGHNDAKENDMQNYGAIEDVVQRARQKWKTWLPGSGALGVGWTATVKVTRLDTVMTRYGVKLDLELNGQRWLTCLPSQPTGSSSTSR